jgi:serine/threonine protein kinase
VAHGDLKKKDNILVVDGRNPCLIDFGVAIIRKERFAPLNHYLYNLFKRFDYNAWAKLKYTDQKGGMDEADLQYVHRTMIERTAGWIKSLYIKGKGLFTGK